MKISIIIPACNEEKYIESALKSINQQNYKDFETIVICDGCTDQTEKIARQFATKTISTKERNVSKARNLGAKQAQGEILIFQDADVQLTNPETLNSITSMLNKAVIGTCKITPDKKNLKSKIVCLAKNNLWFLNWSNGIIYCNKENFKGFNENLRKKEDSNLIGKARKQGPYKISKTKVQLSMRRLEKKGYLKTTLFWIREFFLPNKDPYEIVR